MTTLLWREIDEFVADLREANDNIDHMVEGDAKDDGDNVDICHNPDRPSFTADSKVPRTQNRDIQKAYKDGHIDGRWFEYLLANKNFRVSLPRPSYISVYIRSFLMKNPSHPIVKDFCHMHVAQCEG
ncbi:hypothetical protein L484_006479 [Morus notabilis]|uniref:Uncharacterized protein n=1 Tax=Morus notabilis TaxID=981085 RepID=W9RGA3_9ROSA|nr:hypothetical protein L484_006479 [Morus notabilis]